MLRSKGFTRKAPAPAARPDRGDEFASYRPPAVRAVMATPASFTGVAAAPARHVAQRDPMRPTSTTTAEREYMGRVAALGCVICRLLGDGPTPSQVHHVREGQGASQRAGNFCVIPLCPEHHTGRAGIHGDRSVMRLLKVDEIDLLDITIGDLA